MTKILLLGNGVLGKAIQRRAPAWWDVDVLSRSSGFDIGNHALVQYALSERARFDLIINAAGRIDSANPLETVRANAIGPALLVAFARCPIVHVSTDCVFYQSDDVRRSAFATAEPDAFDTYSITKAAGEFPRQTLVVRTSFVGPGSRMWESIKIHAERHGTFYGWRTEWSGGYVDDVADAIILKAAPLALDGIVGVRHISRADPIRKIEVARRIAKTLDLTVDIYETDGPKARLLQPSDGFELPDFLPEAK